MNYIKRLEKDLKAAREEIDNTRSALRSFKGELETPKFVGVEADGGRKDWMSTTDIADRLDAVLLLAI
jgi:hypothetical protein